MEDEGGYGYGEEDGVEDLNARMAAMTSEQRKAAIEAAQRSQSSKRYQEMERERKRRQLKTQVCWPLIGQYSQYSLLIGQYSILSFDWSGGPGEDQLLPVH